jgi:tRNA pseudouridine55 synthase
MDGILLVDKPLLYSSHDVVEALRRKTGVRRVGHAGTLDPLATGLLVALVGGATRAFSACEAHDKDYRGVLTLGLRTDTQDLEGRILAERDATGLDPRAVRAAAERLVGRREQTIPRYSSAKIQGRKCYELERRGAAFTPPVKTVEVKAFRVEDVRLPDVFFSACVSKGTYIRALCEEMGEALGTGGVLAALRRTRSGPFRVEESLPLGRLLELDRGALASRLLPALEASPA